ncbi:MAG TPA: patatin-like phospholipase family protein [Gemmatimonadaceae bacterium]|nr:patatin-like phospholipase family protein [Gemmatimonadaceae bacterium]
MGGGGLKGFAHIGVLQALAARGITPAVYAGTSIGALMAAAHACGVSTGEMAERAQRLQRRDLFRINHVGMVLERMRSPSLYLEAPLRALVAAVVPKRRFRDLPVPVLVNTVDIERGTQVVWGLPGLTDAWVDEAVYASCALPGFFPPGKVAGRLCIDGGTVDNLPVHFAATLGVDAVIAVDVGSGEPAHARHIALQGFAAIFMRAATTMMGALQRGQLRRHRRPPLLLIRPAISHVDWFTFGQAEALIAEGQRAAELALADLDGCLAASEGIYPRRRVRVSVDRARCIGCGICVALAPETMTFGGERIARPLQEEFTWSPADGDFVRQCPTQAIVARDVTEPGMLDAAEQPVPPALRGPRIRRHA